MDAVDNIVYLPQSLQDQVVRVVVDGGVGVIALELEIHQTLARYLDHRRRHSRIVYCPERPLGLHENVIDAEHAALAEYIEDLAVAAAVGEHDVDDTGHYHEDLVALVAVVEE